ncbi:nucleotidyl transferase AbiEii/AbiGii toxin family protein [Homoserinibacter sp. GY 40078]|uniref:nucleotidyl transferase AbiEii/AbiGii toxin family protein n=1 Tax=Homoserinibacter sp. GY 40078 TaxID=2603275 RepID=UPI00164F8313|nr:nucleotidyl transferase AbiEii/AbiGii toxin family protein [Homoserinibacter sp. GY 40078]
MSAAHTGGPRGELAAFTRRSMGRHEVTLVANEVAMLAEILPPETSDAWTKIVPYVPDWAYLSGGTALAVHLRHRVSRDLDFFAERDFDADTLAALLTEYFPDFGATRIEEGTVNGVLGRAKLQFLRATQLSRLDEPTVFAGLRIDSLPDILANKVKVIGDRAALRDYFDLMVIETTTDLTVDEGLVLYRRKYENGKTASALPHIMQGLGYFDDVDDDPGLPVDKATIESYWTARQPEIERGLHF